MRLVTSLIFVLVLVSLCAAETVPELYSQSYSQEYEGGYDQALESMLLIKSQDDDYLCRLRIGWLLYLLERYDESVEAYGMAIEMQPESVEPYLGLILPLVAQKKWRSVLVTIENIQRNDPANYYALSNKAWALYGLGRYAEAADVYRNIIKLHPADIDMNAGLGWALLKDGKKEEAKLVFDEILRISPDNISAGEGNIACQ
ncbi:MAG: tetratricopeptide repeat protein [bacterium]|nr:tetratricopeptide repeat protein [bacterium]MCP4798685.1 tetratricopeptide repeat protein [bacterium]